MEINSEVREILNPAKTVLLVWDAQNFLVQNIFNTGEFLEKVKTVISSVRENNIAVMFSRISPLPENFESPARKYFFKRRMSALKQVDNGFDLAIEPQKDDIVIPKHSASIFIGTHFENMLRNAGITTILFTGIATEMGVESSARDALNRGFFPVIVTDAVSSPNHEAHNRSLENMKNLMIIMSSEEIKELLGTYKMEHTQAQY